MDWDLVKSGLKTGYNQVAKRSSQVYEYVKSDEFKDKVKTGYETVKTGVVTVVDKVKGNEQVQKIGSKTKDIYVDVKNSEFVHTVKEKSSDIAHKIS